MKTRVPPVLARSRFQLFIFDVPRLRPEELEASILHRARSMSPLHPGQYQTWFHLERVGGKTTAYVFLTRADQSDFRPAFPIKATAGLPANAFVTAATTEGILPLLYRGGILREIGQPNERNEALEALRVQWGNLPRVDRSELPPGPSPQLKVPRSAFPLVPLLLIATGLALASASLLVQYNAKTERNAVWKQWLTTHSNTAAASKKATADLQALKKAAGLPLDAFLDALARAWPDGVVIKSLRMDGWKVTIEAETSGALGQFQSLVSQPGLQNFTLVGIRRLEGGQERLTAEGEWLDGN